jgi:hypothetical protein
MLKQLHEKGTRLMQLRAKLEGRTGADGKPIPGYEKNCEMIRAEIERIEKITLTTIPSDPD